MKDILPQLRAWQAAGKRYVLATVVGVERSAPRGPGASMAVCENGEVAGSVSGGCVEGALVEEAEGLLATGQPKLVTFGIPDELGFSVGLSCGGTLHVFLNPAPPPEEALQAVESRRPTALVTVVRGTHVGSQLTVFSDGQAGSTGDAAVDETVVAGARKLLARGEQAMEEYPWGAVFTQTFTEPPDMYIFGAVEFGAALCTLGRFLGYHVSVCDPRAVFATKERFPDAHKVVVSWPDAFLQRVPTGPVTAICVLTHDPKFDVPALKQALASDAGYIGVMGSRRTHIERLKRLREEGCTEEQLARLHAPIGLDLGSKTPRETAVAIAAELIAWTHGKRLSSVSAGEA